MGITLYQWLADLRQALRGPAARERGELRDKVLRLLEEEVTRQRAETERERAELTRQRGEVTRERAEIDRLREENRAMLNSLLGLAGAPPVETPRPQPTGAPPIRRRSWPQIAATHELTAARQQRTRDEKTP